ncbi:MAG: hypothetical protein ABIH24_02180 [Verrucomicrobiota bacterium]
MKSQDEVNYQWVPVNGKAEFAPRDGAGVLAYKGKMWLIGGWNPQDKVNFPKICNNEVWNSVDGKNWMLVKPGTFGTDAFNPKSDWEGRHCAGYGVLNDKMWIICGDCNQKHYQPDIWNSADGANWTHVNAGRTPPWMPRALQHSVIFKDAIWVMGGQTMIGFVENGPPDVFYNDVWRSADGINWEKIEIQGDIWEARGMIGGTAVLNGRMWIMGGGTYDTPSTPKRKYFNDVWSTADGVRWICHTKNAPWPPRSYHEVAAFDGKLWVMEGAYPKDGERARNQNDVWYSFDGVNWSELPGTPWKPRHAASVLVHDSALWMVAGNNMESDVWKLRRK